MSVAKRSKEPRADTVLGAAETSLPDGILQGSVVDPSALEEVRLVADWSHDEAVVVVVVVVVVVAVVVAVEVAGGSDRPEPAFLSWPWRL